MSAPVALPRYDKQFSARGEANIKKIKKMLQKTNTKNPAPRISCVRTQVNGEGSPLRGASMEVVVLHVEVACADCLGPQSVEQRHLGAGRDAHCTQGGTHSKTDISLLTPSQPRRSYH